MIIVYENKFDLNEWFTLIALFMGIASIWITPKRFPPQHSIIYLLCCVFMAMIFDHTISIEPFDFYDVNDNSSYQLMDFLTYLMYAPFGYWVIYFYDLFKIKQSYQTLYILGWAVFSIAIEFFAQRLGVYHYKNGYQIYYSFPIYLCLALFLLSIYKILSADRRQMSR